MSVRFGHCLCNSETQTIGSASHDDDLAGQLELLKHIGGRVGERPREAVSDFEAIIYCHRHLGGVDISMFRTAMGIEQAFYTRAKNRATNAKSA